MRGTDWHGRTDGHKMTVLTAHKILIGSAIALFAGYSFWEFRRYTGGDASAVWRAALAAVGAVALSFYLRWVWVNRPSDPAHE